MSLFKLKSNYKPTGDQPQAIEKLVRGVKEGKRFQTLLGVTGSGKTFTIANVIAQCDMPALIISHNKTLAAQLYGELRNFFPENAVEYFISYYDYYQPEAFIPATDTYIEKDASINEDIDRLRLRTTGSLMTRKDVIVVASVSCIYGLGSPEEFELMTFSIRKGSELSRDEFLERLVGIQYSRNDVDFGRGNFRVRGDTVELKPAFMEEALRVEFFDDTVERIMVVHPLTGEVLRDVEESVLFPASHFVTSGSRLEAAIEQQRAVAEQEAAAFAENPQAWLEKCQRRFNPARYGSKRLWAALRDWIKSPEFNPLFVEELREAGAAEAGE